MAIAGKAAHNMSLVEGRHEGTAVDVAHEATGPALSDERYFNRELSWIEFNRRVLEEASRRDLPVLERLKFLSIFSTNLDEFYMIRVSGLKEQFAEGVGELSPDGMTASEQLREIRKRLRPMLKEQAELLDQIVLPELASRGLKIERYGELSAKEQKRLGKYFSEYLFPILTPQSVDSSHPFPYISNISLNLGLFIEPDRNFTRDDLRHLYSQKRFTRIKLPPTVPRLVPISKKHGRYALLEDVISANAHQLFPNMRTGQAHLFRVTRDADIELREDEAGDLLRSLERELQRRRDRVAVRLEVSSDMPDKMVKVLTKGVGLVEDEVDRIDGLLNIPDLMQLYMLDKPKLKDKPLSLVRPAVLDTRSSAFDVIKKRDVLLHHPYMAFSSLTDFIDEAADDRQVQAIKICLYRTGRDSPVVNSLIRASQLGKQVTALVELKARFDEENNIEWAKRLENEGVHVVYGIHTLKTHAKVMLIVRREKDKLVRYVHLATGNYNPTTSRVYTDLGILTSNEEFGADATNLFNFLTGYSQQERYHRLLVAPVNLRDRLVQLIRNEVKSAEAGRPARIIAKLNSLTDDDIIEELYSASEAGVAIDLIVRGVCTLRPGVEGMSSNIRVRSIVGRFLEHSRIYYFANGDSENSDQVYIASADWMQRNLDRRVEIAVPVLDPDIKRFIKDKLLDAHLRDTVNARTLRPDGTYEKVRAKGADFDAQMSFEGVDITA